MILEIDSKSLAKDVVSEILKMLSPEIKRQTYPYELKGDNVAGSMLGISADAMKQRRIRGFYLEGRHYYRKNDKIIMWYRDALLDDWSLQNG